MTISANYDWNPSVDVIMRMALQLAGLLPLGREPSAQQLQHARFFLDSALKAINGSETILMQMERTTLTTVSGTASYALAADTLDVDDAPMMQKLTGQSNETQVTPMSYGQYQEITNKTQTGTPLRVYAEKLATVTLYIWPVPDNTYTISYRRKRLIRNAQSGTTLDLTQRWIRGLSFRMAADMCYTGSLDLGRAKQLKAEADELLSAAHGTEHENVGISFYIDNL